MKQEALRLNGITLLDHGRAVLDHLSIRVYKGERVAICGQYQSGKSALAKILTGIIPRYSGEIFLFGRQHFPHLEKNDKICCFYGKSAWFPNMSILDNYFSMWTPGKMQGVFYKRTQKKKLEGILEELGIIANVDEDISSLTYVQQHLLYIRNAIEMHAEIVILDNISTGYTNEEYAHLWKMICSYPDITFLYIKNDCDAIIQACDRVFRLHNGEINGLLFHDEYTPELLQHFFRNELETPPKPYKPERNSAKVLATLHLEKYKKDLVVPLHEGEIVGLLDCVGTVWESLLEDMISNRDRLIEISEGYPRGIARLRKKSVTVIAGDFREMLFDELNYSDNLTIACLPKLSKFGFVSKHMTNYCCEKFSQLINPDVANSQFWEMRLHLSRFILSDPKVLILGNITAYYDFAQKLDFYQLLFGTLLYSRGDLMRTAVLISTDEGECSHYCDSVIRLND